MKNKILSIILAFALLLSIIPVGAMADNVTNYADIFRFIVHRKPTHSTLTSASDGGVTITQIDHTDETGDQDAIYKIDLTNIQTDKVGRSALFAGDGYTGNVKITIKYVMNNVNQSGNGNPFYRIEFPGYVNTRLKNTAVTAFNAGTTGGAISKNLSSNGADIENTMVVEIDTVNDNATNNAVKLTLNGTEVYEATSINAHKSEAAKGAVNTIQFSNMKRMGIGSYLTIKSINIEGNHLQMNELDDETIDMINTFPSSIADDPYNVTGNVTVPRDIPGLVWVSTDESVMTPYGKITRTSSSDNKEVELYAKFNGKTKYGKTVEIKKSYYLTVEGLSDRLNVTQTVNPTPGADEGTEKWYTMPERNGTEDGYPILGDPMNISDEAFFGKWDSINSKWILQPYFKYSEFPLLNDVEAYAKTGDYAKAKQALLDYYKVDAAKKVVHTTSIGSTNLRVNNVIYELMSRNAYATNYVSSFVIDTFKLTKNWTDVDIIATSRLKEALGSYDIFSVMIASVDKYKNQAMVYSRDSEKPPVLTVILRDNTVIECPAVKDSYIRGGNYADTNYGNENILLAEEAGTLNDYEDRTKRIYIGFDITALNKNMDIKRAYVKFTGMHNGSDDEKLMLCYWFCDGSWAEDKICWNTFSEHMYFSCNDMVSWDYVAKGDVGKICGYYRNVEPSRLSDTYSYYSNMDKNNTAYVSDYEKYAYTYIRHNMALINSIGVSRKSMSALEMSTHVSGVSQDVLRLINSEYMTPEVFTAILKHLWDMADYNAYMDFGDKTSNWATFATGAVYAMCARFPEFTRYDNWMKEIRAENERLVNALTYDDGMCTELSQNYQVTLLGTFEDILDIMNLTGKESPFSKKAEETIHNVLMSIFKQSIPGYGGFHYGDSTNPYNTHLSLYTRWYNNLFNGDPVLSYIIRGGEEGELPENPTTNFPSGLRTFMRSDWSSTPLALSVTAQNVGTHGHRDALSVSMFAYGKFLVTDQGYGAILTGNKREYMISPQQHNVVTVNDYKNYLDPETNLVLEDINDSLATYEKYGEGTQKYFDSNNQYDFVEYSTKAYLETELSQRSVMFLKKQKFWIVTDYIIPKDMNKENVYTQNWHLYPGSNMTVSDTKTIRSHFANGPDVMIVPVGYESIDEVKREKTLFSEDSGQFLSSEKAVLWKTKTGKAVYSTIILPMDVGEDYAVTSSTLECSLKTEYDEVNAFSFTVTDNNDKVSNYTYYHLNDESLKTTVTVGDYKTDAQTLLVEEDEKGNVVSIYMLNGTFVSKGDAVILNAAKDSSVAFTVADGVLEIHTMEGIQALSDIRINMAFENQVRFDSTMGVQYIVDENGMMNFEECKWIVSARKINNNSIKVTVNSADNNYSRKPTLVIAEYDSQKRMQDIYAIDIISKYEKLYNITEWGSSFKAFLLNSLDDVVPLAGNAIVE